MDPQRVVTFLEKFKSKVNESDLVFVDRTKNMHELNYLEIFKYQVIEIIMGLTFRDYVRGPSPDTGAEGEVWVFSTQFKSMDLYIKLKFHNNEAKCLSFHKLEKRVNFPLREV